MTNSLNYTPDQSTEHPISLSRLKNHVGKIGVLLFAAYSINYAYHFVMLNRDLDRWSAPHKQEVARLNDLSRQRFGLEEVLAKSRYIEDFTALESTRGFTPVNLRELNEYHYELKRCGFYASLESFRHEIQDRMNNLDEQIKHLKASTKYDQGRKIVEHHTCSAIIPFYEVIKRWLPSPRS